MNVAAKFVSNADLKFDTFIRFEIFSTLKGSAAKREMHPCILFCNWKDDQRDAYYSRVFLNLGHQVQFQSLKMSLKRR